MSIRIRIDSWIRRDNNGLFDYSTKEDKKSTVLTIQKSGIIIRHISNNEIKFLPLGAEKTIQQVQIRESYQKLVLIEVYSHGRFKMLDLVPKSDPLCRVISAFQQDSTKQVGIDVVEGNIFKIGKVQITIQKLRRSVIHKNLYEEIKPVKINSKQFIISKIIPQDYQNDSLEPSFVQQYNTCRICLCKTVTENNPMYGGLCKCEGSSKYTHLQCLVQWVKKRAKLVNNEIKGIYFGESKGFQCQICKNYFPTEEIYPFLIGKKQFKQYIVMNLNLKNQLIYIIDLDNPQKEEKIKTIEIGRSNQCDVVINELSVSRKHCKLQFDHQSKRLKLYDLNSKFGTIIISQSELLNTGSSYQKGRTLFYIQNIDPQRSFWSRFCSPIEDLSSYNKNYG